MGNRKIFIQIASYRDPQLLLTTKDCIDKIKEWMNENETKFIKEKLVVNINEIEKNMISNLLDINQAPKELLAELIKEIKKNFNEKNFAVTDLSHSKVIIEIEGKEAKEVLKKGCPFNFNDLNITINFRSHSDILTVLGDEFGVAIVSEEGFISV